MVIYRKAEVGAIFGLLLAGLSTEKIANILGQSNEFVRNIVPPDWMPPRHGHRRSYKERKEKKGRLNANAVIDHFNGGHYTLQETADAFGVTRERIRQILAKHGVSHRTQGTLPKEIHEARLRRYLAALKPGVSTKQAAEASGVIYSEAHRAAQALGVAMPKPTRASRIKYAEVAAYYEANTHLTGKDVSAHFGITPTTMSRALRIMGVKPRHSGWTHADNMADMAMKGRSTQGERHPNSRINEKEAREIAVAVGSYREIGIRFGITKSNVSLIKKRKAWKHLWRDE